MNNAYRESVAVHSPNASSPSKNTILIPISGESKCNSGSSFLAISIKMAHGTAESVAPINSKSCTKIFEAFEKSRI
jgi:hypothetical protein